MTPTKPSDNGQQYLSRITLALMEDTGWYVGDYTHAPYLQWGRNAGCTFPTWTCSAYAANTSGESARVHARVLVLGVGEARYGIVWCRLQWEQLEKWAESGPVTAPNPTRTLSVNAQGSRCQSKPARCYWLCPSGP